jgi:hypothetical protein
MADPQRCHGWCGVNGCPGHVDGRRVRALMAEQLLSEPDVVGRGIDAGTEPVAQLVCGGGTTRGTSVRLEQRRLRRGELLIGQCSRGMKLGELHKFIGGRGSGWRYRYNRRSVV